MKTRLKDRTIVLTKAEMRAAMIYGTDAYNNLQAIRRDYPCSTIVEEKVKRGKSDFAGLDMKTIRAYVEKHGNDSQKQNFAFISKRSIDEDGEYHKAQSFFDIKKWFLNEFPEIRKQRKDYREKVQDIYESASRNAAQNNS